MTVLPAVASAKKPKLAEKVALRIEADIMAAGWPIGTIVGSEAELQERYGVSRSVLREAVRLVEHHDAATMRRGPSGGLVVRAPDARSATGALVVYLEWIGATIDDLIQARLLLEPLAASLAAVNLDESLVDRLRVASIANPAQRKSILEDPHVLLGEASGNTVLALFIEILNRLTRRYAATDATRGDGKDRARDGAIDAHIAIAEAVIAGESAHAEILMERHLLALKQWMNEHRGSDKTLRAARPRNPYRTSGPAKMKMAEAVAYQIRNDILDNDRQVDDFLGSEAELLDSYGVSRAVLREAIRILESHCVIAVRRGPGGGISVGLPDPMAGIDAIALYLDYKNAGLDDLGSLRTAVELGGVELVCARADDPEVRSRLTSALVIDADTPRADVNMLGNFVHTELADLSGNPVLAMLSRIVTSLWARHNASPESRTDYTDEGVITEVAQSHRLIVEAVLANDPALARRRMMKHLNALTEWKH